MKPEQRRRKRLEAGCNPLPHSIKNPRKLKKTMKKIIAERVEEFQIEKHPKFKIRIHWVPRSGWTVSWKDK